MIRELIQRISKRKVVNLGDNVELSFIMAIKKGWRCQGNCRAIFLLSI